MEPSHAKTQRAAPALVAVVVAVLLTASLVPLARGLRDAGSTLEQLLPESERERMSDARAPFGFAHEPLLVALQGSWTEERLDRLRHDLEGLPDVRAAAALAQLEALGASPDLRFLQLELEASSAGLAGARRVMHDCNERLQSARREGERTYAIGLPRLRAESWDAARSEIGARLPLLALLALGVPWLFLGSASAGALALLLAACTTSLTLWSYRLLCGPPSSLILLVIPLLWAVATLDAMHLAGRVAHFSTDLSSRTSRARRARTELLGPCLVTTLTTAVGFLSIGTLGPSGLLRGMGLASALGVVLAFVLTFTIGTALVAQLPLGPPPRWPRRLALGWVRAGRRSPRASLACWGVALIACATALPSVRFGGSYPAVFSAGTAVADDLEHLAGALDSDLAPIDVILQPESDAALRAPNLASAVLALTRELRSQPSVRAVLPLDLVTDLPGASSASLHPEESQRQLEQLLTRPEVRPWADPSVGTARLEVHFVRNTSWAQKRRVVRLLEQLDASFVSHFALVFAGPGYAAFRVEELAAQDLRGGGLTSLIVLALVLIGGVRYGGGGLRTATVVLACSLLPLIVLPAGLAALNVPWSVTLLPLPSLLIGLAVDDSVHLTWGSNGRVRLRALPAILATTVLIAASVGTLTNSALRANRDLGLLLAGGLIVALAADLTLLPALARRSRRRSPR